MANLVDLTSCLRSSVLCLLCIAAASECAVTRVREMPQSRTDSQGIPGGKTVSADAAIDYLPCRRFFKQEICDKCFLEDTSASDKPNHGGTSNRRDVLVAPAAASELTRLGSVLVSKLRRGACSSGRSKGRVRRASATDEIDTSWFVEAIYEKYGMSGVLDGDQLASLLQDLGIGTPLDTTTPPHRNRANTNHTAIQQCFLATELADIFNVSEGIPQQGFASICPSLIQQITQGCVPPPAPPAEPDLTMYGWATLAVAVIKIVSFVAMLAVPAHGSRFYAAIMQLFVALAVSSLSGDALLHLLPEALGMHGIVLQEGQPSHILITLTVILPVYFFFLFERVTSLCLMAEPEEQVQQVQSRPRRETFIESPIGEPQGQVHVQSRPRRETFIENDNHVIPRYEVNGAYESDNDKDEETDENDDHTQGDHDATSSKEEEEEETPKDKKAKDKKPKGKKSKEKKSKEKKHKLKIMNKDEESASEVPMSERTIFGFNMLLLSVFVGDVLHNITDCITIGASFASGPFPGLSTASAVFYHEVPHEVGDYAMMRRNGVSFKKAMLCSMISHLLGFVGLYAGLLLGSEHTVQRWIFAATAGIFLYTAFVSLIPEMIQQADEARKNHWRVFLRQNIGLLLGWTLMFAIGLEDVI